MDYKEIIPYQSMSFDGEVVKFGTSTKTINKMISKPYSSHIDSINNTEDVFIIGRGRILLCNGIVQECSTPFRMKDGKPFNVITLNGEDVSCYESVEKLKKKHSCYISRDKTKTLFPDLGISIDKVPFMDDVEPRKNIFDDIVAAFSKEYLLKRQIMMQMATLHPFEGVSFSGSDILQLGKTYSEIGKLFGNHEQTFHDFTIMKEIREYRFGNGIKLRYRNPTVKGIREEYNENMPLQEISIREKYGWDLDIDGIRLFEDEQLIKMKNKYEFEDSVKGNATLFPQLGILAIHCGKRKNKTEGKRVRIRIQDGKEGLDYLRLLMNQY